MVLGHVNDMSFCFAGYYWFDCFFLLSCALTNRPVARRRLVLAPLWTPADDATAASAARLDRSDQSLRRKEGVGNLLRVPRTYETGFLKCFKGLF